MTGKVRIIVLGAGAADLVRMLPDWVEVVDQSDWIAIADQLPELDVTVIAHNDITQAMGFASIWEVDNGRPRWDRWPAPNKPTHWRPAPVGLPIRADPREDLGTAVYAGVL